MWVIGPRPHGILHQAELESERANIAGGAAPVWLHPRLSEVYARKAADLEVMLDDQSIKLEAAEILRALIDRIDIHPQENGGVDVLLCGDIANIVALSSSDDTKNSSKLRYWGVNSRWLRWLDYNESHLSHTPKSKGSLLPSPPMLDPLGGRQQKQ